MRHIFNSLMPIRGPLGFISSYDYSSSMYKLRMCQTNSATFCHFASRYRPKTILPPTLHIGVRMQMVVDADECQQKKNTYLIMQMVVCMDVQKDGVHADMDESKGEKKELTDLRDLLTGASGGRGMRMCGVQMPMSAKKKRRKKKTYLKWGYADVNALRADGIACGWVVWGHGWW